MTQEFNKKSRGNNDRERCSYWSRTALYGCVITRNLKIQERIFPSFQESGDGRGARVETPDTVDKYLSKRSEKRVQLKLIKSRLRVKTALWMSPSVAVEARRRIQTSSSTPRLCLSPPCMHTCEFLIRGCTRGTRAVPAIVS